jgi:hypothetical protein
MGWKACSFELDGPRCGLLNWNCYLYPHNAPPVESSSSWTIFMLTATLFLPEPALYAFAPSGSLTNWRGALF